MTEVVAAAGFIFSVSIFVAHALDASDALMGVFMGRLEACLVRRTAIALTSRTALGTPSCVI